MKNKKMKGELLVVMFTLAILMFNFAVMPLVLATVSETSDIQTVTGNTEALNESSSAGTAQVMNFNAISKEQAIKSAIAALKSSGFDTQDFKNQPIETRYITETAPAGDPVWAIIFCDDKDGYAYAFGNEVNDETRDKLAALGEVETCTDENGTPGIRAHYSYTRYTLVEINALSGKYIRHGDTTVELGEPLHIDETHWTPITEEDWEQERQRQEELQQKMEK